MAHDEVCKAAEAWVEEANAANTERMRLESTQYMRTVEEDLGSPDPVWQALARSDVVVWHVQCEKKRGSMHLSLNNL